ncbi:MAG TPA: hypothetical protein V6C85_27335 [Allocoleopsis sp.]
MPTLHRQVRSLSIIKLVAAIGVASNGAEAIAIHAWCLAKDSLKHR